MSRAIFRSTSLVGSLTLLSRVTGLVREMVYAQFFGASALMDAFLVAFKIPNFLRRLFAEGAFSQGFVPVISEYRHKRSHEETRELVAGVAGTLGAVLFVVTVVGVVAAPILILVFAPGFRGVEGQYAQAVQMLRFTFPYVFFISLTALFSGVLNSYGRFAMPALTQVVMNVVMIVFTAWLAVGSDNPGLVMSAGVFVAGLLQVGFQLPAVAKLGLLSWPRWRPALDGVRRIGKLMIPGIVGSSMAQVSLLLDTLIASFLVTGSIAWLYFADRLMEFPLGVFSIALATVILPGLSAHHAKASKEHFSATLDWALRLTLLLASPAAVGMLVFAGPLTATIFGRGEFNPHDVRMTSYALMTYSFGMLFMSLVKVLAPGYFARQDTKAPLRAGLIALGVNIGLNVIVVLPAARMGFPAPHALLAISTSISAGVNTYLLLRGLRKADVYTPAPGWPAMLVRIIAANGVMAAALVWLGGDLQGWLSAGALERVGRCALCIGAGAGLYFAALYAFGLRYRHLATRAS
ncbi:MAG TPA: murein biosynthesis integral membrane protein MurJ [Steroidobacteraceae bacterium]|nr:murein biosynthesis integral membrane protein MurJ [Steroidobacteraceae bacterium]